MRLGKSGAIVYQNHLFTGDVEQLVVLGTQRAGRQEAVLGELAQNHQPLAVGITGFAQGRLQVTRLIVHVGLLQDVVDLLALVVANGGIYVPLHYLAVNEQRGVGVATTVKGGVQRTKAQLGLGHDDITLVAQLVGEQVWQHIQCDYGYGWRQLAVGDPVLAVRRGVNAVRVLRHWYVAGVGAVLAVFLAAINHWHVGTRQGDVLAGLDVFFDLVQVKDHYPVTLVAHLASQVKGHFGVVAGGTGKAAGVVGGGVIEVTVNDALPHNIHGLRIQRGVHGEVFGFVHFLDQLAIVGVWNDEFAVGVNTGGAGHTLTVQTVDRLGVGDEGDLVSFHHIQTDTGNTGVGLVVDERPATVIVAIGAGRLRVVGITVFPLDGLAEHFLTLVGDAPTGGGTTVEHRNTHQLAHGRNTNDAHLTGLTATPDAIVLVQFGRAYMGLGHGILGRAGHRITAGYGGTHSSRGRQGGPGHRCCTKEAATAHAVLFQFLSYFLISHYRHLLG